MQKTLLLLSASLVVLGACSSSGENQPNLLRSGAAGSGVAGSTLPGGSGASGSTSSTTATAGRGMNAAGQGTGGRAAPQSSAGVPATAGGASTAGAQAAGMGSAGAGAAGRAASAGSGAGGAGGTGAAGNSGSTAGTVMVQFTTVSYGGEYAPLNYGAVWFERGGGGFVKTAKRWAGSVHATDLVAWTMASGGWGSLFGGGNTADMMDAVSMATLRMHQTHMVSWNMKDAQKQLVPDGDYVAVFEMSENRALVEAGPVLRIPFTKGPMAQTVMMPDEKSFTGISLHYTP